MMKAATHKNQCRCFICDCQQWTWDMCEIRDIYQIHGFKDVCELCGNKANSFVGYWGKKKAKDKADLKSYLNSGLEVQRKYSAMMNGGYYENT